MRTLSPENYAHIRREVMTFAVCWRLERHDGVTIRGTEHDRNIAVPEGSAVTGIYRANAGITGSGIKYSDDMSVDNMEVSGALSAYGSTTVIDVSAADIEAGLLDGAEVSLFIINWQNPADGPILLQTGTIGEIKRDTDGGYSTELRGLTQLLTKIAIRTYGASCDAELGDARCKFPIVDHTFNGTITTVIDNRSFIATIAPGNTEAGYLNGGKVHFNTGECTDFEMEIKTCGAVNVATVQSFVLYLPMTMDIAVGDTFYAQPGCDKSPAMCKGRFHNLVNFRGHGWLCPGMGAMGIFGGQTPTVSSEDDLPPNPALEWPRPV